MKTLKVVLQEVVSGLKSWVNTNTVHKTGNETINGVKTFSDGIVSDVTGSATSVPWTGVTGKPSDYPPSSHPHGNITNDGKVGTTANLPLITGTGGAITAGAFGNQANTFCEGNDSRLSDARTPLSHTHTKSDVTDLLNSNFIPSTNNSYDLGSSSYQWNNLYAKNYYYNGVAWGLDKANEWTGINTFTNSITTKANVARTVAPASDTNYGNITCRDKNGSAMFRIQGTIKTDLSNVWDMMMVAPNNTYQTFFKYTISSVTLEKELRLKADSVIPDVNSENLGTSTNRWKTLNGINPGALSLPDVFDSYDVVTTNWGTAYNQPNDLKINGADPSYPGWLFIKLDNCTAADDFVIVRYFHVNATNLTFFGSFIPTASSYVLSVPIQAGIVTKVWVSKIPTTCKYYACLGTVK